MSAALTGIVELPKICSTMLPPNKAKARCATVSPTDCAITAATAD